MSSEEKIKPGPNGGISVPVGGVISAEELAKHADSAGNILVTELRMEDGTTIRAAEQPGGVATSRALAKMAALGIDTTSMTGAVQTAEFWATKHGMLPEIVGGKRVEMPRNIPRIPGRVVRTDLRNTSKVAPKVNPKHLAFKQARLFHGWPEGAEMTEAQFLAAVDAPHKGERKVVCR
jgi:hypothetical protein